MYFFYAKIFLFRSCNNFKLNLKATNLFFPNLIQVASLTSVFFSHSRRVPTLSVQAWVTWNISVNSLKKLASCRRPTSSCRGRSTVFRKIAGCQKPKRCATVLLLILELYLSQGVTRSISILKLYLFSCA